MHYGPCPHCREQVVWARSHRNNRPMPLQPDPDDERGNVLLDGHGRAHVFRDRAAAEAFQAAEDTNVELAMSALWLPHYAVCRHRRVPTDPGPAEPVVPVAQTALL